MNSKTINKNTLNVFKSSQANAHVVENHLDHEHKLIENELREIHSLVFSPNDDGTAEIGFRNRLKWVTYLIEAHFTSEERVVFKYLDESASNPIQKCCIENICEVNGVIDEILDELDRTSWKNLEIIQSNVLNLIQLFGLHTAYEERKLFRRLNRIPDISQKGMVRELISTENRFKEWLLQLELIQTESLVH